MTMKVDETGMLHWNKITLTQKTKIDNFFGRVSPFFSGPNQTPHFWQNTAGVKMGVKCGCPDQPSGPPDFPDGFLDHFALDSSFGYC